MLGFSVTYERWDEESLECGDTDDRGYVVENVSLRDALREFDSRGLQVEPSSWPYDPACPYGWFTADNTNDGTREFYEQGIQESRSLHLPRDITTSTRRRIARLLGVRVGR